MDRTELGRGTIYSWAAPFDKLLHISGVPRDHWGATRNNISFETYEQDRLWKQDPDLFRFRDVDQKIVYDGLLATISGTTDSTLAEYAGLTAMVTSRVTPAGATLAASFIVKTLLAAAPAAHVTWVDANERTYRGRTIGPNPDMVPDLCVVSGLSPDPSIDNYETVQRFHEWGRRYCLTILVGTGLDPIELAIKHFRIKPSMAFLTQTVEGASRTRVIG